MSRRIVCDRCGKSIGGWNKLISLECTRYYQSGRVYGSTECHLCLDCWDKFVDDFLKYGKKETNGEEDGDET